MFALNQLLGSGLVGRSVRQAPERGRRPGRGCGRRQGSSRSLGDVPDTIHHGISSTIEGLARALGQTRQHATQSMKLKGTSGVSLLGDSGIHPHPGPILMCIFPCFFTLLDSCRVQLEATHNTGCCTVHMLYV